MIYAWMSQLVPLSIDALQILAWLCTSQNSFKFLNSYKFWLDFFVKANDKGTCVQNS